jgi:hypothetical protein
VEAHEQLAGRVLEYVCAAGSMDAALQDEAAKQEVSAAMESVFPLSTIVRFSTLSAEEKLQQV